MIKLLGVLFFIGWGICAAELAQETVERFDVGQYHPENAGLKDLSCELRVSNLLDMINQAKSYGKLDDLYFKVHWTIADKFTIDVEGFPNGFKQKRDELKALVIPRLDFLVPQTLGNKLKGLKLTGQKLSNGVLVKAVDTSHLQEFSEIHIYFDDKGRLTKMTSMGPVGVSTTVVEMNNKPWSNNKWLVDSVKVSANMGMQQNDMEYTISYAKQSGIILPNEIKVVTKQSLKTPGEAQQRQFEEQILITNCQINQSSTHKALATE